ncbi:hypothetical protein VRK_36390 [Vibrio sp. MEBiC08052]|nr:hypothetical protein VRK_36390 [Vibrio sp. MEBiC08052]
MIQLMSFSGSIKFGGPINVGESDETTMEVMDNIDAVEWAGGM